MPIITYLEYESQKTTFFKQKAATFTKAENIMAREFKTMKEMMSLLSNDIKIKLNSLRDQENHPRQLVNPKQLFSKSEQKF